MAHSLSIKRIIKKLIPVEMYSPMLKYWRRKPLYIRWGNLRHLTPCSQIFGLDRGQPIDRYYIENFLKKCRFDIRGRVLEVGAPQYTQTFGGERVSHSDVLHVEPGNSLATIVGNLATGEGIPQKMFDCIILTQVLLCIYDVKAALANAYNALKPGGVLLATIPGISQISRYDMDRWGDYWRFTDLSVKILFAGIFPVENTTIEVYGNVLTATAYLQGIAAEELKKQELEYQDPNYQVIITVRAVK